MLNITSIQVGEIRIRRLLHAGLILECGAEKILFDPILENPFSQNCFVFPPLSSNELSDLIQEVSQTQWNAVIISHIHDDHFSLRSLNCIQRATPIFIYSNDPQAFDLLHQMGFTEIHFIGRKFEHSFGTIKIKTHEAQFDEVDQIFEIEVDRFRMLHLVDARPSQRALTTLKNIRFDLILAPYQQMRELEILCPHYELDSFLHSTDPAAALLDLHAKYIVPFACQFQFESWSWLNQSYFFRSYEEFQSFIRVNKPDSKILRLPPASSLVFKKAIETWSLSSSPPPQESDYESYSSSLERGHLPVIQSTQEISRQFVGCDHTESELIRNFFDQGFQARFQELESSDSRYFSQPWVYMITVWDSGERLVEEYYEVAGSWIEKLPSKPVAVHWRTEIISQKLLRALQSRETLSSMYIRVNAPDPLLQLRDTIEQVSPIEDPLIRVLFDNNLLAYQTQQLKDLQSIGE